MIHEEFELELRKFAIERAKAEAKTALLEAKKAKVELETAEMVQRHTAELIAQGRGVQGVN